MAKDVETIIGSSVRLEGEFASQGDILIEGEVIGNIRTAGNIRLAEGARVKANIEGANIVVSGQVKGNIAGTQHVELGSTANVSGDIMTQTLSIAPGAIFNGRALMGEQGKGAMPQSGKRSRNFLGSEKSHTSEVEEVAAE